MRFTSIGRSSKVVESLESLDILGFQFPVRPPVTTASHLLSS